MSRKKNVEHKMTESGSYGEKLHAAYHGKNINEEAYQCVHFLNQSVFLESIKDQLPKNHIVNIEVSRKAAWALISKHIAESFKTGDGSFFRNMGDEIEKSVSVPDPVWAFVGTKILTARTAGRPIMPMREAKRILRTNGIVFSDKTIARAYAAFGEKEEPGRPRKPKP